MKRLFFVLLSCVFIPSAAFPETMAAVGEQTGPGSRYYKQAAAE